MAETTADVRRDIELTRARISDTLQELEQKMNVAEIVKKNPWPALAIAVGAGVLLSGSRADVRAAAVTADATRGAGSRISSVLDEIVATVIGGFQSAIEQRIDMVATDVKRAITAPLAGTGGAGANSQGSAPRAD